MLGSDVFGPTASKPAAVTSLTVLLYAFCIIFAVNSAVHSYLIVRYSEGDKVRKAATLCQVWQPACVPACVPAYAYPVPPSLGTCMQLQPHLHPTDVHALLPWHWKWLNKRRCCSRL